MKQKIYLRAVGLALALLLMAAGTMTFSACGGPSEGAHDGSDSRVETTAPQNGDAPDESAPDESASAESSPDASAPDGANTDKNPDGTSDGTPAETDQPIQGDQPTNPEAPTDGAEPEVPTEPTEPDEPKETEPPVGPEAPDKPAGLTYEEYQALSSSDQYAYFLSYTNPEDFFTWYNEAVADYEERHPGVVVGPGGIMPAP